MHVCCEVELCFEIEFSCNMASPFIAAIAPLCCILHLIAVISSSKDRRLWLSEVDNMSLKSCIRFRFVALINRHHLDPFTRTSLE